MNIVNLNIDKLIPYINNPRNNDNAIDKVAASIREFGFKVPIIVDKNYTVVTGHTRLLASKKLELEEVPCVIVDDLSDAQIKAFRIADNKVSEYSTWDIELLQIELESLSDLDIDLEITGFNEIECMEMLEDLEPTTDDYDLDIDDYDEISEGTLKAENIMVSYFTEDERMWLLNFFKETSNPTKRLFSVRELMERYEQ